MQQRFQRSVPIVLVVTLALIVSTLGFDEAVAETPAETQNATPAATATTRYRALAPCRLADTRTGVGYTQVDGHTSRIELGRCDIPTDATALVATTTIINTATSGWLVAYPTGTEPPEAATLNWSSGMTRGNSSTITVGAGFSIDLFRSDGHTNGHLVVDVVGAFVPAETSARGRYVAAAEASRLLDTREAQIERPGDGAVVRIPLPDDVPDDADAVAINITAVDTTRSTFVTAYPAGGDRPMASVLNADDAGQFRSAATIVPVTPDGFDVYVESATNLVVDMTGWFTGPGAEETADGLFVPLAPTRLRDTRGEVRPIYTAGTIEIELPAELTGPATDEAGDGSGDGTAAAAVAISMTMISADERGYVTAHAARADRPDTASGYALRNEITAQFATPSVSDVGLAVYSEQGTDLTVDLLGWFTGTPTPTTSDVAAPNPQRQLRVLAVGDSSMAGVRWYQAYGALTGASWTFAGESCRRLVRSSCRGREGRYPPTAVSTIASMPDVFDVLVVMTGYNDQASTFEADLEQVMATARSRGIRRVVWLTYSPEFRTDKGGAGAYQVYEFQNVLLRSAAERHVDLVVADWSAVARQRPEWVHYDGIHLTDDGAYGNADFMSRAVAFATGQPCPVPAADDDDTADDAEKVCPDPGSVASPDVRALYGFSDTNIQCWEVGASRTVQCVQDPYTY